MFWILPEKKTSNEINLLFYRFFSDDKSIIVTSPENNKQMWKMNK